MESIDRQFIEFYRAIGRSYGFDDLTTLIYARLFIDPDEIAMEDLAKETGYSLASVSNKLKVLETSGVVTRRTRPGTRKVYVYADKDMRKSMISFFVQYQKGEVVRVKEEIPRMIEELEEKNLGNREKAQAGILKKYYNDTVALDRIITQLMTTLDNRQKK